MKKIVVRGPALSQSGYGEQTRFALRSLLSKSNLFDVYLLNTNWGQTSWLLPNDSDKEWIDALVRKTAFYTHNAGTFDMSMQVTIPNEWEQIAPVNIGYTAGIETTKVSAEWVQKSFLMDKILVISHHSRNAFLEPIYEFLDENNQKVNVSCQTPIDVVHYPVRNYTAASCEIDLPCDFNYLAVAQWGPRKNLENTIRWWIEEFKDEEVGLIVKTSLMKNSLVDRLHTTRKLQALLSEYKDRKCKVHLLHGYMTPEEMTALYQHKKVKCFISLAHGEGFGLPIFEAAYNGLPVITPDWSGQKDYLHAERKVRRNKKTVKKVVPCFAKVNYDLKPIQPNVVWDGVLIADSSWCYAKEHSYKSALRNVYKNPERHQKIANTLQEHIQDAFAEDKMYESFCNAVYAPSDEEQAWMEELSKIEIL